MPKVAVTPRGKPYIDSLGVLLQHAHGYFQFTLYKGVTISLTYDNLAGLFVVTRRPKGRGYRPEEIGRYPNEGAACRAVAQALGLELAPEVLPWPERTA